MAGSSASSSGRKLLERLIPSASRSLKEIVRSQREMLWGPTDQVKLRIRSYPKSGEERVTVVKPCINTVKLYSQALKKRIPVKLTSDLLREVEAKGGLDAYLLKTPERLLGPNSDFASGLRYKILCATQAAALATASAAATTSAASAPVATPGVTSKANR